MIAINSVKVTLYSLCRSKLQELDDAFWKLKFGCHTVAMKQLKTGEKSGVITIVLAAI